MSASCMSATAFETLKRITKHAQTHGHRVLLRLMLALAREALATSTTTTKKAEKINIK